MMIAFAELVARCRASEGELKEWIALAWVRPATGGGNGDGDDDGWMFTEADCARVELICDLLHDMAVGREAMDVILPLIDQVYALRREMRTIARALDALPEDAREAVLARVAEERAAPEKPPGNGGAR